MTTWSINSATLVLTTSITVSTSVNVAMTSLLLLYGWTTSYLSALHPIPSVPQRKKSLLNLRQPTKVTPDSYSVSKSLETTMCQKLRSPKVNFYAKYYLASTWRTLIRSLPRWRTPTTSPLHRMTIYLRTPHSIVLPLALLCMQPSALVPISLLLSRNSLNSATNPRTNTGKRSSVFSIMSRAPSTSVSHTLAPRMQILSPKVFPTPTGPPIALIASPFRAMFSL